MSYPSSPPRATVLFVDDEPSILRSLERLMLDQDVRVLTASSGREGLALLKREEVAVIVSDQKMPEMSGSEFLANSRDLAPDAVRMILTGYAEFADAMDAINKGGAYRYVTKPWKDDELVLIVQEAVDKYLLVKENRRLTALTVKQNDELRSWGEKLQGLVVQQTMELREQNAELLRLNEKLKNNFRDIISAFLRIIEMRDEVLFRHSLNVAALSGAIAEGLGLGSEESENIVIAAELHDIGALWTPDLAVVKETKDLAPEELADFLQHPIRGQAMVDSIEDMRRIGLLIRHHHEWFNGEGFPDRLSGEQIPLGARIIAVSDKFDWLASRRLGDAFELQEILDKIKPMRGNQLDASLYGPLARAVREKAHLYIPSSDFAELEVNSQNLRSGMVLSRDIRTGTGLLLLSKGTVLNDKAIDILQRYDEIDPFKTGVFIYTRSPR